MSNTNNRFLCNLTESVMMCSLFFFFFFFIRSAVKPWSIGVGEIYAFLLKNKSMPREVSFSVTLVPNKVWGEMLRGGQKTKIFFFSMLSRGSLY